jgi:hypothetical protein
VASREQVITAKKNFRVEETLAGIDKVIILFAAMGTRIEHFPYRVFVKRLTKKGYSCIIYDFPPRIILSGDFDIWQQFSDEIIADAKERIKKYKKRGAAHFYAYGVSIGSLYANMLARSTPEISHVILNLSHGDVARNIWTFKTVRQAKQNLIDKGFDEAAVRQNITYLDPIFNAPGLKGKKILLQLSRQDKIFPKEQTKHLKLAFEAAGLDMTYLENKHLGHIPAATKNVMSTKIIDTFYSS